MLLHTHHSSWAGSQISQSHTSCCPVVGGCCNRCPSSSCSDTPGMENGDLRLKSGFEPALRIILKQYKTTVAGQSHRIVIRNNKSHLSLEVFRANILFTYWQSAAQGMTRPFSNHTSFPSTCRSNRSESLNCMSCFTSSSWSRRTYNAHTTAWGDVYSTAAKKGST